jgi:hypothetical protein
MRSIIANVRAQAAALREALLEADPARLEGALPGLEVAARDLRALAESLAGGAPPGTVAQAAAHADLAALQAELHRARHLALRGEEFCREWSRLRAPDALPDAAYTPRGEAAPARVPGAISVEG